MNPKEWVAYITNSDLNNPEAECQDRMSHGQLAETVARDLPSGDEDDGDYDEDGGEIQWGGE